MPESVHVVLISDLHVNFTATLESMLLYCGPTHFVTNVSVLFTKKILS